MNANGRHKNALDLQHTAQSKFGTEKVHTALGSAPGLHAQFFPCRKGLDT